MLHYSWRAKISFHFFNLKKKADAELLRGCDTIVIYMGDWYPGISYLGWNACHKLSESREQEKKGLSRRKFYHKTGISNGRTTEALGQLCYQFNQALYEHTMACVPVGPEELSNCHLSPTWTYHSWTSTSGLSFVCIAAVEKTGITYSLKILTCVSLTRNTLQALNKCLRTALQFYEHMDGLSFGFFIFILIATRW